MTVATGQVSASNSSASNAHALMVEIRRMLLEVGLDEVTLANGYDASGTGTDAQVPTTANAFSSFMAFAFSDQHQQNFPIVLRFRVGLREMGYTTTSDYRYLIQFYVSEGLDANEDSAGRGFNSTAGGGISTSNGYMFVGSSAHSGSFARYNGHSLTLIVGLRGLKRSSYPRDTAVCFLHLERNRDVNGNVIAGFSGIYNYDNYATNAEGSYPARVYYPSTELAITYDQTLCDRSGGIRGLISSAAQVVAPIYSWSYTEDRILPLRSAYSIGAGVLNGNDVLTVTLDFTGEEKPYLIVDPVALGYYPGYHSCAWVFEWQ